MIFHDFLSVWWWNSYSGKVLEMLLIKCFSSVHFHVKNSAIDACRSNFSYIDGRNSRDHSFRTHVFVSFNVAVRPIREKRGARVLVVMVTLDLFSGCAVAVAAVGLADSGPGGHIVVQEDIFFDKEEDT
jgi:hypothetical protein